jgi:hypothetical protein
MDKPEVILNLWYVMNKRSAVIYRLLARAYAVEGTDEQKMQVLESLAATDYLVAHEFGVPERFEVVSNTGKEKLTGVARWKTDEGYVFDLFAEALEDLEKQLPVHTIIENGQEMWETMRIPDTIQFLLTPLLEDEDGNIVALI